MLVGSALEVQTQSVTFNGFDYTVRNFFGLPGALVSYPDAGPQSQHSTTSAGGATLPPHYHTADQYQVFLSTGTVGRHGVEPVSVHYTDAYTTYGPIIGSSEGLTFLTLRADRDTGARFMPGDRKELAEHPRGRQLVATLPPPGTIAPGTVVEAIEAQSDGVHAWAVSAAANTVVALAEQAHGGTHVLVLAGSLLHDGRAHPAITNLFLPAGDPAVELRAGNDGMVLLLMEFAKKS